MEFDPGSEWLRLSVEGAEIKELRSQGTERSLSLGTEVRITRAGRNDSEPGARNLHIMMGAMQILADNCNKKRYK